jgi:hypothetical protein
LVAEVGSRRESLPITKINVTYEVPRVLPDNDD